MNLFVKDLPPETQILIAMGSAVAAGCEPCLKQIVSLGKSQDIDSRQLQAAAAIGQFVKDQPRKHMKSLAKELLGDDVFNTPIAGCDCNSGKKAQDPCCGS